MENNRPAKPKALLALPLLILPFVTLGFWALKGCGNHTTKDHPAATGIDLELPRAHLKMDPTEDKLRFYEQAQRDSEKFSKAISQDPLLQGSEPGTSGELSLVGDNNPDPSEEKIYRKILQIKGQLNQDAAAPPQGTLALKTPSVRLQGVERLESLLHQVNQDSNGDPEVNQLNQMMDKILEIENLGRQRGSPIGIEGKAKTGQLAVKATPEPPYLSVLGRDSASVQSSDTLIGKMQYPNRFYSTVDPVAVHNLNPNTIRAAVYGTQTLISGSVIKMRLLSDIQIKGQWVPKNSFVYGVSSLTGDRLHVQVTTIRCGENIYPVALSVYDMDGLEGIYVPGASTRDEAKASTANALQSIGYNGFDPSVGAQAVGAGIATAKNLVSKKVKQVRLTVKAGYQVLLDGKMTQP